MYFYMMMLWRLTSVWVSFPAVNARQHICGSGNLTSTAIAEATAEAFALAVATASAECELNGTAQAYVNADAKAEARANVWLEAYASAFASASVCDNCEAYASSWGYVSKHVFLEAVAEVSVQVSKSGPQDLLLSMRCRNNVKIELFQDQDLRE
jgi:hypothetical protein